MIQEYLFVSNATLEEAKSFQPKGIKTVWTQMEKTDNWIATFSLPESFGNAKRLSELNTQVMSRFHPVVLVNDSAAFYNKKLYPIVNEFERVLRKALYLKGSLHKGEKAVENLKDLETKEFGKLFDLLFTDDDFIKRVKEQVNSKTWNYSKNEILDSIKGLTESTLWDMLFAEPQTLSKKFVEVRKYRNDVMHAHNIDSETYDKAMDLFQTINKELKSEISRIVKQKDESSDYSEVIHNAIAIQKNREIEPDIEKLRSLLAKYAPMSISEVYERLGYDRKQYDEIVHQFMTMTVNQQKSFRQEDLRKESEEA